MRATQSAAVQRLLGLFPDAVGPMAFRCVDGCAAAEALWHGTALVVHAANCPGVETRVGAPVYTDRDEDNT